MHFLCTGEFSSGRNRIYLIPDAGPGLDLWGVPRQIFFQLGVHFR